jgi:hypothetical protein
VYNPLCTRRPAVRCIKSDACTRLTLHFHGTAVNNSYQQDLHVGHGGTECCYCRQCRVVDDNVVVVCVHAYDSELIRCQLCCRNASRHLQHPCVRWRAITLEREVHRCKQDECVYNLIISSHSWNNNSCASSSNSRDCNYDANDMRCCTGNAASARRREV